MHTSLRPARRLALVLLAVLVVLAGAPFVLARPADQPGQLATAGRRIFLPMARADGAAPAPPAVLADLNIRPVPLREVQRGNALSVEYRFRNDATQAATASFSLFYPSRLLIFTQLDASGDRFVFRDATRVIIEVRNVAPGATRVGRVNFLVASDAGIGSRIGLFAEYGCRSGVSCQSNFAELEVTRNNDEGNSGGVFTMAVAPDRGPPGTAHTFSGARFRPNEPFVTWLNTPTGVLPLSITGRADGQGRIQFTYGTGGITQAGFYSMVAHGQQSNIQNVGAFIVQINGQPAALGAASALVGGVALPSSIGPLAMGAPAQATGDGGIAGRVVDSTGAGVADVSVEVISATGELVAVARSRADGVYFVPTGLASGQYTVTARPSVNPSLALLATATVGPVGVTAPGLTAGVNLTLPAAGGLAGAVKMGGAGIGGVRVAAINAGGAVVAADLTDATGVYSITNLPAGSYTLRFDPQGARRAGLYGGGELAGQSVTAGTITSVPDFTLTAAAASGVISGKVSDGATGAGIEDVLVVITRANAPQGETFVSVARTESDGVYSSDPLGPGSYRVQFVTQFSELPATARYSGEFYNDAASFAESDPLAVVAGQQATADAALAVGGSISGNVSGGGDGVLADVPVVAFDGDGVPRALGISNEAGVYRLGGLRPGSYTVRAFPGFSPNSAARAFVDGGYDATPATPELTPVAVEAGAALTSIDITLSRGATIVGTVSAGDTGEPLRQVGVVFVRNPGSSPTLAGVAITDATGRYTSPALAAGSYTIWFTTIFSADATARSYQDEFFNNKASLAEADAIVVGAVGSTLTRNVDLALGGAVRGRVSGADSGAGLGGVFVVARAGATVVGGAISDEAGDYSLAGLPPGQVTLSFEPAYSSETAVRAYKLTTAEVSVTVGAETTRDVELALN